QRAIHIEKWVVSCRADQTKISTLDVRQKNVLLGFVEMVNLVDEQNGLLPSCSKSISSSGDNSSHFGDVAFDSAQAFEFRPSHIGNNLSQGSFACARRAGQDY